MPALSSHGDNSASLREVRRQKKGIYVVRTRHLKAGEPVYTNRLILEDSPYLLQHAHNPVNWYAWGDEAFATARKQNKPAFLSIGYSTCHWCHVMEEESFDDEAVAAILNRDFISIKVDRDLLATEDRQYGGQAGAPKFPNETSLLLLLEHIERIEQPLSKSPHWQTLYRALDGMMRGGIYDQVAGGFHRYSTDAQWLRPHFEKMLYNQAQLSRLYTRAWKLSGHTEFRRVGEETLSYVLREMRSKEGAFYSATDADREGEEGKYYIWPYQELKDQLKPDQLALKN